jgi:cell division protein FtsQ
MLGFYKWRKVFFLLVGGIALLTSIVWAESKHASRLCVGIRLHIANKAAQGFIQEPLLLANLAKTYPNIVGMQLNQIASKKIENTINSDNFVYTCTVYKNCKGYLKISVTPKRPIARIVGLGKPDQYIDGHGELLPVSANYTARVLLIYDQNLACLKHRLQESEYGSSLLQLLHLIDQDPFWQAQINQISMNANKKLLFTTQLGPHLITFGRLEKIVEKMKKLKLFYKVILPYKGWKTYQRVNLEFEHQIVCE